MFKAYKYRIYPSDTQKVILSKNFGACRWVWNHFLDLKTKMYSQTGKGITYKEMALELKMIKKTPEYEWLNEINSQSLQQSLMHLDTAFSRFFKHMANYPQFKKKAHAGSSIVPQHFRMEGNKLYIPKFKDPIRVFKHREFDGEIRSMTISRTSSGKYYASLLILQNDPELEIEEIKSETTIGIDVGLKSFMACSDGVQIGNPKKLITAQKKLKKTQRNISRKKKGSANRKKQSLKLARMHEHVANQRNDFLNKISDVLVRNYDTIAIEDLNINGMMKNHHLARAIGDAGWSSLLVMLKTKALQRGKNIIEIGRFEPSSKLCSRCGNIKHDLRLSDRTYHCNACGLTIDRDLNAAINIKKFALIKSGVPTDSGEFTPMDRSANTIFLLQKEGIQQVHWLK